MAEHIRLDGRGDLRQEVPTDRDGFGELRSAISSADASGNLALLAELQARYRREIRDYREGRSASAPTMPATKRSALASMAWDAANRHFVAWDDDRFVSGILNRYGVETLTGLDLEGSDSA